MKRAIAGFSLLEVMIGMMLGIMILSSALLLYTMHFKIMITIKKQNNMIHLIRQSFLSLQLHMMRAGYSGPQTHTLDVAFSIASPGEHERLLGHTQAAHDQAALSVNYAEDKPLPLLAPIIRGDFMVFVPPESSDHTHFVIADSEHSETFMATSLQMHGKQVLSRQTPFEHSYGMDATVRPWTRMDFFLAKRDQTYTLYQYNRSEGRAPVALVDGIYGWALHQTGALLEMTLTLEHDAFTLWLASDYVSV